MTEGLVGDKRRQATDSIRGYVYQAYQSVLAWMRLGKDEVLFLEGAEDFDVHSADGVTATQVKDTAGSGTLTLRSGDAVAAINNFGATSRITRTKWSAYDFSRRHCPDGREGPNLVVSLPGSNTGQLQSGMQHSHLNRSSHFFCLWI